MQAEQAEFLKEYLPIFRCPKSGSDLRFVGNNLESTSGGYSYSIPEDNIPRLFVPNDWDASHDDITSRMKDFYEETPFPNYDDFDDAGALIDKARKGVFARLLDEQIPWNARIIECGCGTGQLSNFLSIANRTVIGADMTLNSLRLAQEFKEKNDLHRAFFTQMNLFRPCFQPESFDVVISNGVLHHTSDPFLAFKTISTLVKPKGYLLIGLYHTYGRISNDIRRMIFKMSGDRFKGMDKRVVDTKLSAAKRKAWFMDQYKNPHESKHTINEALDWVKKIGFSFVSCIPKSNPFEPGFSESEQLFKPMQPGNRFERFLVDTGMLVTGGSEGGFFIIIAQKK